MIFPYFIQFLLLIIFLLDGSDFWGRGRKFLSNPVKQVFSSNYTTL